MYQGNIGLTYTRYDLQDDWNDDDIDVQYKKLLLKNRASLPGIFQNDPMTHVMPHELLQLIGKHGIIYDKQYLDQLMRIKVPFEKIIIKYTTNGWYGILNEWYNKTHSIRITIPKLKTRKYIKIIEKFSNNFKIKRS